MPVKATSSENPSIELSSFQQRVFSVPEILDLILGGARGGGKSWTMVALILRFAILFGSQARMLLLRQSFPALGDLLSLTRELFGMAFGSGAKYNSNDHIWTLPGGATLELGFLTNETDYGRYQGRSFTLITVDEAGQWPVPLLLDRMLSNLRGPRGVPTRYILAANPGGVGHQWLARRYCLRATPWVPDVCPDTGRPFVYAPSTLADNTAIDQAAYRKALEAACAADPELLEAWLEGSWAVLRGAFFSSVLDEDRVAVDPALWVREWFCKRHEAVRRWQGAGGPLPIGRSGDPVTHFADEWELYLAMDWGSAAPMACYVCAESPGGVGPDGRFYARGSVVLVDELSTHDPANPAAGLGWTVSKAADAVRELCERWGINPRTGGHAADPSIFARSGHEGGSIGDQFAAEGVLWSPAGNSRAAGWERMRSMLQAAGEPDRAGLYVSRACRMWWETTPTLPRDPRRPEDLDTKALDHWADSCRYGLMRQRYTISSEQFFL